MLKRLLVGLVLGLCVIGLGSRWAGAEEAGSFWEKTQVSGTVDTTYSFAVNRPTFTGAVPAAIPGHAMEPRHNSFDVNLVELAVETQPTDWATVRFDLDFGQDVAVTQAASVANLQQGYITLSADNGLSLTLGQFVTLHGAEVIERGANYNISHSFLFTYAIPFMHTGAKIGYAVNDDWGIALGIVNGWNNVAENNAMKTIHALVNGKIGETWSVAIGGTAGPEIAANDGRRRYLLDGTIAFDPNENWHFALNGDLGADQSIAVRKGIADWWGAALYLHYRSDSPWGATVRGEYAKEDPGAFAVTGSGLSTLALAGKIWEGTLTVHHYMADGLEGRLEYRHDQADRAIFPNKGTPGSKKGQDVAAVELVYTF